LAVLSVSLPLHAGEKTVFVLTGKYENVWDEGEPTGERALMIAQAIKRAAEDVGWTADLMGECKGADCLEEAVEKGADQAVSADVEAYDARYNITVRVAGGGERKLTLNGAFKDVVVELEKEIRRLLESEASIADETTARDPVGAGNGASGAEPQESAPSASDEKNERGRLRPPLFWACAGLSLGLTGTWIALDVVTHKRYQELKKQDKGEGYLETSTNLQLASRVLFGLSVTAMASTVVIAVLTDFKKAPEKSKVTVNAFPTTGGGAVLLSRSF
jgi:hypothetical protein